MRGVYLVFGSIVLVLGLAAGMAWWASGQQRGEVDAPAQGLETLVNSLGMEMIKVPAGSFTMGGDAGNQQPLREVKVASFYISAREVTQAQWAAVMGYNPSTYKDPRRPVEMVSWLGVQSFLEALNRMEGARGYRLPTEAEWEYAARAGGQGRYFFGDELGQLSRYAWYEARDNVGTRPAGALRPNPWGLFDMHGNVWEWVQECWHPNHNGARSDSMPRGGGDCSLRTVRGGGWDGSAALVTAAVRGAYPPDDADTNTGFRVVYTQ